MWQEIIEKLIENENTDVDMQDEIGKTCLHLACEMGQEQNALGLMDRGASCDLKTKAGKTALDVCKEKGHMSILGQLREILDEREEEARVAARRWSDVAALSRCDQAHGGWAMPLFWDAMGRALHKPRKESPWGPPCEPAANPHLEPAVERAAGFRRRPPIWDPPWDRPWDHAADPPS